MRTQENQMQTKGNQVFAKPDLFMLTRISGYINNVLCLYKQRISTRINNGFGNSDAGFGN